MIAKLYTYVGNDPLDRTDPSGLCFIGTCEDGSTSFVAGLGQRAHQFVDGIAKAVKLKMSVGLAVGFKAQLGPIAKVSAEVAGTERAVSTTPTDFFKADVRGTKTEPAPGNSVRNSADVKVLGVTLLKADNGDTTQMSSTSSSVPSTTQTSYGSFNFVPELGGPKTASEVKSGADGTWDVGVGVKAGVAGASVTIDLHQLFNPYDQ